MAPGNAYGHCNGGAHPNQQPAGCEAGTLAFTYVYDGRGLVTHRDVATDEATTATDYTHDGLGRLTGSTTGIYVATYPSACSSSDRRWAGGHRSKAMALTEAAQAVQRSAFPDAYAKWEAGAPTWPADILDDPAAAVSAGCVPASESACVAIAAAERWLGTPYSWGGGDLSGPRFGIGSGSGTVGFDCSGLTRRQTSCFRGHRGISGMRPGCA